MYINSAKGTWSTSFDWASFCFRLCHQQYFKQRVGFSSVVLLHHMYYIISPSPSPSFPASLFPPNITEKLVWLKGIIWCHKQSELAPSLYWRQTPENWLPPWHMASVEKEEVLSERIIAYHNRSELATSLYWRQTAENWHKSHGDKYCRTFSDSSNGRNRVKSSAVGALVLLGSMDPSSSSASGSRACSQGGG